MRRERALRRPRASPAERPTAPGRCRSFAAGDTSRKAGVASRHHPSMPSDLVSLLSDLVAIDSVNPSLVPGGAGEARIAAHVAGWAADAGLEAEVLEGTPGRPSVLVRAPG